MIHRPGYYEDIIAKAKSEDYLIVIMQEVSDNSDISDAYWQTLCKLADEVLHQFRGPNYCICKTHDNRVCIIRTPERGISKHDCKRIIDILNDKATSDTALKDIVDRIDLEPEKEIPEEPKFTIDMVRTILRFQRIHRHDYCLKISQDTRHNVRITLVDMDDIQNSVLIETHDLTNEILDRTLAKLIWDHNLQISNLKDAVRKQWLDAYKKAFGTGLKIPLVARGQHKTGPVGIEEVNINLDVYGTKKDGALEDYEQRILEADNVDEVLDVLELLVYFHQIKMTGAEDLLDDGLIIANQKYEDTKFIKVKIDKEITIKVEKMEDK